MTPTISCKTKCSPTHDTMGISVKKKQLYVLYKFLAKKRYDEKKMKMTTTTTRMVSIMIMFRLWHNKQSSFTEWRR